MAYHRRLRTAHRQPNQHPSAISFFPEPQRTPGLVGDVLRAGPRVVLHPNLAGQGAPLNSSQIRVRLGSRPRIAWRIPVMEVAATELAQTKNTARSAADPEMQPGLLRRPLEALPRPPAGVRLRILLTEPEARDPAQPRQRIFSADPPVAILAAADFSVRMGKVRRAAASTRSGASAVRADLAAPQQYAYKNSCRVGHFRAFSRRPIFFLPSLEGDTWCERFRYL